MLDNPVSRYTQTLRQSQWASAEALQEMQQSLLERLLLHAVRETDGYADRLAHVADKSGRVDLSRWSEIPFLQRSDLQDRQDVFRARTVPGATGSIVPFSTSGSTGRPIHFVKSALLTHSSRAIVERAHDWAGANRDLPYATISVDRREIGPPPDGHMRPRWSHLGGEGRHGFLSITAPISVQVDFLDRLRPAYLKTYPTNIAALARYASGLPWHSNLRHVFTFAETLADDQVEIVREKLGVGITDFYASEESGQMATRCPHSNMYHVAAESNLVEVLREDDSPCGPGESGRVVVTPFYNYALPLIRYEQNDIAELPTEPCGCGRSLPTIKRILGRTRDMFVLPDGDHVWPQLRPPAVMKFLPARQWQAVQTARDHIEVRYVDDGSGREPDHAAFQDYIYEKFAPGITLTLVQMDRIDRSAGGKFREFMSMVE